MENVDWRHLTTGSSGLTGQARSQLNRMLDARCAGGKKDKMELNELVKLSSKEFYEEIKQMDSSILIESLIKIIIT